MASSGGQIAVKAGPVVVAVAGASVASLSTAAILVAGGAAVAVAAVGFGAYKLLSSKTEPSKSVTRDEGNLPEQRQ